MFYDVRLLSDRDGRCTVIVRKVFPKKRKRNKFSGLEVNFCFNEKRYNIKRGVKIKIKQNGRFSALAWGRFEAKKLKKGDTIIISANGSWKVIDA